ncbi:MAG: hypothetical protein FVQ82_13970 [Planctomycetes bacterium]|nr:hypothetical protein [Planctomycetota bacterium]
MSLNVAGQEISKLKIVEDDENTRDSLAETVEDVDIIPDKVEGPLGSLDSFLRSQANNTDAFIFDHQLKQSGFAEFNGAQAVAELYKRKCPSMLCTAWTNADIDSIRLYRRYIPSLIHSDEINPDIIAKELEICINEFREKYLPSREPIKTLVRIENVDNEQRPPIVNAVVPSWNSKEVIRFPLTLVPLDIRDNIKGGVRLWAQVNLGANDHTELFLDSFEFRG